MRALLEHPSPNERVLAQLCREAFTGVAASTYALQNNPATDLQGTGLELVFKNGSVLYPPTDYTIAGNVITFTVALVNGDKVVVWYPYGTPT